MCLSLLNCRFGKYIIYQRFVVIFMCAAALVNAYGTRYCISNISPYIRIESVKNDTQTEHACKRETERPIKRVGIHTNWTRGQLQFIQGIFYVGYVAMHFVGGHLADVYGGRHVMASSIFTSAIVILLTPLVMSTFPWWFMVFLNLLHGSSQGMTMTSFYSLISHWSPTNELTILLTAGYSGTAFAHIISATVSSQFLANVAYWKWLFYFWGGMGILYNCFFMCTVFSQPHVHPFISQGEKELLESEMGRDLPPSVPWKKILTDSSVWATTAGQVGHNWILFIVDTNLPKYFQVVLGLNVKEFGYSTVIIYSLTWIAIVLSGYIGNYVIVNMYMPVIYLRITCTVIGNILPGIFALLASYGGCNIYFAIIMFGLSVVFKGVIFAGIKTNILDITRYYAGVVQGIENGLGGIVGVILPSVIYYIAPDNTFEEWKKVFWLSFAIAIFTTAIYILWSSGERADWDKITYEEDRRYRTRDN